MEEETFYLGKSAVLVNVEDIRRDPNVIMIALAIIGFAAVAMHTSPMWTMQRQIADSFSACEAEI
ncbi:hypothetical protein MUP38_07035 [Candidatus Bathyarchaeota archaeon]|nr:hypothetical protein [Candidatus Bathyarchaeota archaeon]